ncbi:MAG: hypothetical protein WDN49_04140 [Acetobacteraceae bacterium]
MVGSLAAVIYAAVIGAVEGAVVVAASAPWARPGQHRRAQEQRGEIRAGNPRWTASW